MRRFLDRRRGLSITGSGGGQSEAVVRLAPIACLPMQATNQGNVGGLLIRALPGSDACLSGLPKKALRPSVAALSAQKDPDRSYHTVCISSFLI